MKRFFIIFISIFVVGCSVIPAAKESPRKIIEQAMLDSGEFSKVVYVAKTEDYHVYLIKSTSGIIRLVYISTTYPLKIIASEVLFYCDCQKY